MRRIGVLMPLASLPSPYGIGDFGHEAERFITEITDCHFQIWQLLPLNPLGYGHSPYQPFSSHAIDEIYLSLDRLYEEGLISKPVPFMQDSEDIAYEAIRAYKRPYLKEALKNFKGSADYEEFKKQAWLADYALFMTLKKRHDDRPWSEWDDDEKFYPERRHLDLKPYAEEMELIYFGQYLLNKQLSQVRLFAKMHDILIMGDIPFYVGLDSDDVWAHKDNFLLDEDGSPSFIAGVPPDFFSATGQRWGNPLYNWDKIAQDDYHFWNERLLYTRELYDLIRVDHFRAFESYWKIPSSCPTAMVGEWIKGPGYAFFDQLFEKYPDIDIIAEDLGEEMENVEILREHYDLKGMRIITEALAHGDFSPGHHNCVAYSGTHDNMLIKEWLTTLNHEQIHAIKEVFHHKHIHVSDMIDAVMIYVLKTHAEDVVLPMGDLLQLGEEARINKPGTIGQHNWEWRMTSFERWDKRKATIGAMIAKYGKGQ